MRSIFAIALVLGLAACGQANQKGGAEAPPNLETQVARYEIMLGQVGDLTVARPGVGAGNPAQSREIARALRETVWSYNLERSRICAKGLFTEAACGTAYEPVWISEPATTEPTMTELQARSDDLGEQVTRFWTVVCDDARTRESDEKARALVCAME